MQMSDGNKTRIKDLEAYATSCLNTGLDLNSGESSFNNSFKVKIVKKGILFIPFFPAGYQIDNALYQKIFMILSIAFYPLYTLLKQASMQVVPLDTDDIHVQRALLFPWVKGVSKRLMIPNLDEFVKKNVNRNHIPIMQSMSIDLNKCVGIAIAGNSGSGKSFFATYLLNCFREICLQQTSTVDNLVVIDPKMDTPTRWAKKYGVKVINPESNRSNTDFLNEVCEQLSNGCLNKIYSRQKERLKNPDIQFPDYITVIDENAAMVEGANKKVQDQYQSLISKICLLGRSCLVHLCIISQSWDYKSISVSSRNQLNIRIQMGTINSKTTSFLFPDLDPSGIVLPVGKGTGLIQVIDDEHSHEVFPLLTPTYSLQEGIL